MKHSEPYNIIIVGGGPAGVATALHLSQHAPHLMENTMLLEAKEYPRPKLCGGGITIHGEQQLEKLGITIDVPDVTVDHMVFRLGSRSFTASNENAMRIIERARFDAALAQAAQDRGLCIHTGERLTDIAVDESGVTLTTDTDQYRAKVVVAADGANSTVRRKLQIRSTVGVARLLRVLTPHDAQHDSQERRDTAVFDFSPVLHGIQGYMWDFPCVIGGETCMNRGIFDSRIADQATKQPHGHFKQIFASSLQERDIDVDNVPLKGHPVRWFNPDAEFSRPRILLVGDAAGVDPLFAEGISYAMEYGELAANSISEAFANDDFAFQAYREQILHSRLGRLLMRRASVAKHLYQYRFPPFWALLWQLAAVAPAKVQRGFAATLALLPP